MTPAQAAATLEATFKLAWGSRTEIAWENTAPSARAEWVRFTVRIPNSREQAWSGNTVHIDRRGAIYVYVFTPLGTGAGRGRELGEQALAIFEAKTISGVHCRSGTVEELGIAVDSPTTFVTLVTCEFRIEDARVT